MNKLADVVIYALGVSAILVMTRPGSQGPKLVTNFGNAMDGLVKAASGQ